MPRRSTLTQRVIFQVQRLLADGASVEESALVTELNSKNKSEVDVLIRREIGGHEVLIAIECREGRRKATVEWVDQMKSKHDALPTSKLILFSNAGFSKRAQEKAKGLGIDCYSMRDGSDVDWTRVIGGADTSGEFAVWALRIKGCWLVLKGDERHHHQAHPETAIFTAQTSFVGGLREVIHSAIDGDGDFSQAALDYARKVKDHEFLANLGREPPLCVLTSTGELREVRQLRVLLEARECPSRVQLQKARYRDSPLLYGEFASPAGRLTLSLVQLEDGSAKGAVSVGIPELSAVSTSEVYFPSKPGRLKFVTGPIAASRNLTDDPDKKDESPK